MKFISYLLIIPFAAGAQEAEIIVPAGHHLQEIYEIDINYNGQFLRTSSRDRTNIWEMSSGRLLNRLTVRNGTINDAEFSPDGNFVAIAGSDSTLSLWQVKTGKQVWEVHTQEEVNNFKFSPDGKYITTARRFKPLAVWETAAGRLYKEYFFDSPLETARFSHDGSLVIANYESGHIVSFDLISGKSIMQFLAADFNTGIPFISPDGRYMVSVETANSSKTWDFSQSKLLYTFPMYNHISFSPDSRYFVTSSNSSNFPFPVVYEAATGKIKFRLQGHRAYTVKALFSPDGKYIITASGDETAKLWDASTGKEISSLNSRISNYELLSFSSDSRYAVTAGSEINEIVEWYIPSGEIVNTIKAEGDPVSGAVFSPAGDRFASYGGRLVHIWDREKAQLVKSVTLPTEISKIYFHNSGNWLLILGNDNIARKFEISSSGVTELFKTRPAFYQQSFQLSGDGKYILYVTENNIPRVSDFYSGKKIKDFIGTRGSINSLHQSADKKYVAASSADSMIRVWDFSTGKLIARVLSGHNQARCWFDGQGNILVDPVIGNLSKWDFLHSASLQPVSDEWIHHNSITVSPRHNYFSTASSDHKARLWDNKTNQVLYEFKEHGIVYNSAYTNDEELLFTFGEDGVTNIRDIKSGGLLAKLPGILADIDNNDEYFILINETLDLYRLNTTHPGITLIYKGLNIGENDFFVQLDNQPIYRASRNAARQLSFKINDRLYAFDQFDLKYNRPDLFLSGIGSKDSVLIESYYQAWLKRINRMGIDTSTAFIPGYLPEVSILNAIEAEQQDHKNIISLNAKLQSPAGGAKLKRIFVTVNDIPIHGNEGLEIPATSDTTVTIPVELEQGRNVIRISCISEQGGLSFREPVTVFYRPRPADRVIPRTYFIGIGVNDYANDKNRKLDYAVKDIRDLDAIFRTKDKQLVSRLFLQENAKKENILQIKNLLMQTRAEDKVIIALSGHGLLDTLKQFYFGTSDIDFKDPSARGLKYESIEGLLEGIPSRHRLLLIDACHSGELDNSEMAVNENSERNLAEKGNRKGGDTNENESVPGLESIFDLMKEIFTDFSSSNGTVVISAARGTGFAEETARWGNGAFTLCLKAAISPDNRIPALKHSADKDNNGLSVNELKDYILTKVPQVTNGRQKPTTRKENIEADWMIF